MIASIRLATRDRDQGLPQFRLLLREYAESRPSSEEAPVDRQEIKESASDDTGGTDEDT